MKKRFVLVIVMLLAAVITACSSGKEEEADAGTVVGSETIQEGDAETETGDSRLLSEFHDRVIELVLENNETGDTVAASDVAMDQIFYGSFSSPGAKEALVVCRILNMPHAGGLGRSALLILETDSMSVVAYGEIPADGVWVETLPMSNGQERIVFSGTTTYQGISTQNTMYFCMREGQWTEAPVAELEALGEDCFCFLADDVMVVTSRRELTDSSDITALLTWDPDSGDFTLEQSYGNPNALSETEINGFNSGFFNSEADVMHNMLLSSEYGKPGEIDLFQLFYNGINRTSAEISEEELELLAERDSSAPYLDVMKIPAKEMDDFLREMLGIGLEETEKKGLDQFYYLEEYDSYYVVAGDTNYELCTVVSGFWESEDILKLQYTRESGDGLWEVTLREGEDADLFVSNVKVP